MKTFQQYDQEHPEIYEVYKNIAYDYIRRGKLMNTLRSAIITQLITQENLLMIIHNLQGFLTLCHCDHQINSIFVNFSDLTT
jgi:tRNA G46 methylase TrmB